MFDNMSKASHFPYANMVTYYCYVKNFWSPRYNIRLDVFGIQVSQLQAYNAPSSVSQPSQTGQGEVSNQPSQVQGQLSQEQA